MGKRVRPGPSDSFGSEVQRQFAGLADQWGLEDPVEDEVVLPTVTYVDGRLTYDGCNQEDRLLSVAVSLVVAEGTLSAYVDELVAGAGLGSRQQVRTSAQTWHALQQSIASHVDWLGKLHPMLTGPETDSFLERAGARRFSADLD